MTRVRFRNTWMLSAGVLACGLLRPQLFAQAPTNVPYNVIGNVGQPIGVAVGPNETLVSYIPGGWPPLPGNPVKIVSIDSAGNQTPFATMPDIGANPVTYIEDYLAISPGLGCFPAGNVYVTQGNQVYVIAPAGGTPVLFATIPNPPTEVGAGITFDTVGNFGFNLIVTTANGYVYTIDCRGKVTQIAFIPNAWLEQGEVAPATFGKYAGDLFVAGEKDGFLYIVGPNGLLTQIQTNLYDAEAVRYIPAQTCCVGTTGNEAVATLFSQNQVIGIPASALQPVANSIVVFGEFGQSVVFTTTSTGDLTMKAGPLSINQLEDIAVFNCAPPKPPRVGTGRMTGGGSVFTANSTRVTHGFELHCNANDSPNNLEINWSGYNFHLENLTSAYCFMDPRFSPVPPNAPFNTYIGQGTGKLNNVPGATARWIFTDAGEPGTKDRARIVIMDAKGNVVLTVDGLLKNGNQQAHK